MKRLLAILLVATLAGCLDDGEVGSREATMLKPGAHWLLVDGNPNWSLENGTATIVFLGENQTRIGSLFLENQTALKVDFGGRNWVAAIIQSQHPVTATNILASYLAMPQFAAVPLLIEETPLGQITEPLFAVPPLQANPVQLRMNHSLNFAATELRLVATGTFTDLQVTIETERGVLFKSEQQEDVAVLLGPTSSVPVAGRFHQSAIGGNLLDIDIQAQHFEGTLILEAIGVGPSAIQSQAPIAYVEADEVAFKFGVLQAPSRIDLHPDASTLYLQSDAPAMATVFDPAGARATYEFNGTIAIPAHTTYYGLVPGYGSVRVGSDRVPQDFEMRLLQTSVLSVSNQIDNPSRFEVEDETIVLPGYPYLVQPDRSNQAVLTNCNPEGFLELNGPNGTGTLAYHSDSLGFGSQGFSNWVGQEVTVTKGQPRNPCHSLILDIHTFSF